MIPDKVAEILRHEGVVAIVTEGKGGPHVVNTWNSYVRISGNEYMLIPVGGMNETEKNVENKPEVLVTIGSREVEGFHGMGTGFLITGAARFIKSGVQYEETTKIFPWARAVLEIKVASAKQTL